MSQEEVQAAIAEVCGYFESNDGKPGSHKREAVAIMAIVAPLLTAATQRAQAAEEAYTQLRLQVGDALKEIHQVSDRGDGQGGITCAIEDAARHLDIDLDGHDGED